MSSLNNKTALVTGSTSGIGKGIALALAAEGTNIVFNGFGDADEIAQLQEQTANDYDIVTSYSDADLTKPSAIKSMVEDALKTHNSIDIVVNNAGIQHVSPIEDFPADKWDKIIALNLSSSFHTIQHCLPGMKEKGWGRIINIASAHGLVASANKSAYVAAKHGIIGLTKVVALETAKLPITCNAICPGWVLTPLVQKQVDAIAERKGISIKEAEHELLAEKQPALQFATPEQIGALAVFLCQDNAALTTGASLSMDGGWTAQ